MTKLRMLLAGAALALGMIFISAPQPADAQVYFGFGSPSYGYGSPYGYGHRPYGYQPYGYGYRPYGYAAPRVYAAPRCYWTHRVWSERRGRYIYVRRAVRVCR